MTIRDFFITPIFLILFSFVAYLVRPYVTTPETRKYFMPALWARFMGAIVLGLIYQFYYDGGDTFNYWTHGSRWIWEAFQQDVRLGLKLLLESGGVKQNETFEFSQHIWYHKDINSYFIVRLTAIADLFTFHTYSASATFFAFYSFTGMWALYSVLHTKYPKNPRLLAFALLFLPSVIFWGSGILKDTITLAALAWLGFAAFNIIELKNRRPKYWIIGIVHIYIISLIKVYILVCFLPTLVFWVYLKNLELIKISQIKYIIAPIMLFVFAGAAYLLVDQVGSIDQRYDIDNLAQRAAITAYDIRYGWGARTGGQGGYNIGLPDGTWQGMLRLMPAAINVTLFRPYLWEIRNPLMLLSALESLVVVFFTGRLLLSNRWRVIFRDPFLFFCLSFSLLFAFAVGVSTFNFGTLMRYKIPLLPFYMLAVGIPKR